MDGSIAHRKSDCLRFSYDAVGRVLQIELQIALSMRRHRGLHAFPLIWDKSERIGQRIFEARISFTRRL